ncbi:cobaltochelatase subunit CobN, partial [Spirulina sp. CS-785/01]|uniref:cobaltochelatase subunit CobN n=1 Tax=Spirulina sp. CS-785/01 TaxID=3021716 RepID=UPI00232D1A1F
MHRIAATPGGWTPDAEGVIFLEQTPASIIFITAADTDIQTLAAAVPQLPDTFPSLRVANLLQLQQQLSIDTYADDILSKADVIILRLLGGRSYWSYGLEVVKDIAAENNTALFVLPGDDKPDPDLISHSTVSLSQVNQLWQYFTQGGVSNWVNACQYIAATCLNSPYHPHPPQTVPRLGTYYTPQTPHLPQVGILFYRSHYLAGNTKPIDALCNALKDRNLEAKAIFISSLRDEELHPDLLNHFADSHVLLNTTSFSLAKVGEEEKLNLWTQLNLPVLQVILSGGTQDSWESSYQGLSPRDVAMNVALPEVDGRIITRAVSFKSVATWNENLETDVVIYEPQPDRINIVADMAANWVRLRTTPPKDRKIALILANYPNKDGRLANGVGLDTPASCINILHALQQAGYTLTTYPETGDELIQQLTQGVTNDSEMQEMRPVYQSLPVSEFWDYFHTLPPSTQQNILDRYSQLDEKIKQRPLISLTCKQLQQIVQSLPSSLYSLLTNPNSLFDEKINRQVEYTITPQEILTLVQSLPNNIQTLLKNPNSLFDEKINRQITYTITPQEILTLVQSLPNNIQTLLKNPNSLFDEKINRQVEYTITPQEILTLVQSLPNNIQTLLK